MSRRTVGTALAALVLMTSGGAAAAASTGVVVGGGTRQPDVPVAEVARTFAAQLNDAGISGGAVALVSGGRVEARGVGTAAAGRSMAPDTPFVIGSASKSFTALAVMQLVDRGRLELEDPVRDYVPELALDDPRVDDITVRDLLQQTSGLDDLAGGPLLASAGDGTPLAAIGELAGTSLTSEPGRTWRYANANYVLAGLLVERVSGDSYGAYVEREIFSPLGMAHSSADTEPTGSDVLADGHRYWFGVPVGTEPARRNATLAAGYVISTAADLGRYLSLYLSGGLGPDGTRIVSASSIRTLLAAGPAAVLGPWAQQQGSRYAMGWFSGGPWGEDALFHPGNTPDTTTMLALFPERDLAVAVMVGAGNELPVPGNPFIADRVTRNVVHSALDQPVPDLPSMWRFYAVFDLVALLLLGAASWGLRRAGRALTTEPPSRHRARAWTGLVGLVLAAGVLVLVPTSSYGWGGLWTWAPDLAVVIAGVALLLAGTAVLRLVRLLRPGRGAPPAITTTEGKPDHVSA